MHIKENEVVKIFKNDKSYSIGMSRKDRNGEYFYGYFPCQFKNGVEIENKSKIKLKNAFISFYLKDEKTMPYLMVLDYEKVENEQNYAVLKGDIDISEKELPF